jgi:transposase-like protein
MAGRNKRDEWAARIAAWERSGQSRRAWCDKHGVNVHTLDYWRRRFRSEPALRKRRARLVPIVVAATTAAVPFAVVLPSGVQLRVPADADVAQVAALVRALQAC